MILDVPGFPDANLPISDDITKDQISYSIFDAYNKTQQALT